MREYTENLLRSLPERAARLADDHRKYLRRLRDRKPKKLDETFQAIHAEVFEKIDCLACANCCKTTSPRWMDRDIKRAAKFLNMHHKTFKLQYLQLDEDEDYVFRKTPCPFLLEDNTCFIYDARPKACAEYPHTDRKNMRGLLVVTRNNIPICPAVFEIVEKLRKKIPL